MIELVFWHGCSQSGVTAPGASENSPRLPSSLCRSNLMRSCCRAYIFLCDATYQTWRKYLFQSSTIAIILFVIFEGLSSSLGGVRVRPDYGAQISRNFKMMIDTAIIYPPTLAFGLPIVLAILGYKSGDQFMRAERLVRRNDSGHFGCRVEL